MYAFGRCKAGLAIIICLAVGACERAAEDAAPPGSSPRLSASTLGEQEVRTPADYLADPEYRDADPDYGERLSLQCRACHSFEKGGPHMIGPNLHDFFGRAAGSVAGFPYSRAMREVEFIWTPRALDAWLASPGDFLPGSSMTYAGLPRASDRRALIASLLRQTSP